MVAATSLSSITLGMMAHTSNSPDDSTAGTGGPTRERMPTGNIIKLLAKKCINTPANPTYKL